METFCFLFLVASGAALVPRPQSSCPRATFPPLLHCSFSSTPKFQGAGSVHLVRAKANHPKAPQPLSVSQLILRRPFANQTEKRNYETKLVRLGLGQGESERKCHFHWLLVSSRILFWKPWLRDLPGRDGILQMRQAAAYAWL